MAEEESALSDFEDEPEATPVVLVSSPEKKSHDDSHDQLRKELDEVRRQKEEADKSQMELRKLLNESLETREVIIKERDEALKQVDLLSKQKEDAVKARELSRSEIESAARVLVSGAEKITSLIGDSSGGLARSPKYTGFAATAYGFCKRAEELVEGLVKQREAAVKSRNELGNQMEQRNIQIAIEVSQLEAAVAKSKEELETRTSEWQKVAEKYRAVQQNLQEKLANTMSQAGSLKTKLENTEEDAGNMRAEYEKLKEMLVTHFKGYLATEESFVNFLHKVDGKAVKPVAALPFSDFCDVDKVHQEYLRRVNSISDTLVHMENSWAEKEESRHKEKLQLERSIKMLSEKEADAIELLKGTLENRKQENAKSKVDDDIVNLASALDVDVRNSRLKLLELERQVEDARMEVDKLTNINLLQAKHMAEKAARIHELEEKDGIKTTNVEELSADIAAAEEELATWKEAAKEEAAAGLAIFEEVKKCNKEIASLNQMVIQLKQSLEEANSKLQSKEEMATAAMAARDAAEGSLRVADERAADLRERLEDMSRQVDEAQAEIESRRICGGKFLVLFPWFREKLVRHKTSLREATTHASAEMEELMQPLV